VPGNPEHIVVGKMEKSARRHGEQKDRPAYNADQILQLVRFRLGQLAPAVDEYNELLRIDKILSRV
jgi:hypothetical protein